MTINDFDKIYCLSLTNEKDRYNNCIKQFNNINLSVDFWYTCKRKWNRIENVVPGIKHWYYNEIFKDNPFGYSGVFNCALEQYTIIKTSYERGMNYIAIIEDDINFIDDKDKVLTYLYNIPNDFNIIKFSNHEYDNTYNELYHNVYSLNKSYQHLSSLFYGLDRKGMEIYIDYFDNIKFTGSDMIFKQLFDKYENYDYKFYIIDECICHQKEGFKSNIDI